LGWFAPKSIYHGSARAWLCALSITSTVIGNTTDKIKIPLDSKDIFKMLNVDYTDAEFPSSQNNQYFFR